jgi:hypothetical protein
MRDRETLEQIWPLLDDLDWWDNDSGQSEFDAPEGDGDRDRLPLYRRARGPVRWRDAVMSGDGRIARHIRFTSSLRSSTWARMRFSLGRWAGADLLTPRQDATGVRLPRLIRCNCRTRHPAL